VQLSSRVLSISKYPTAQLTAKKKALIAAGKKVYDFGAGDPIEPTPVFIREAVGRAVPEISQYPTVRGAIELRRAIQGYLSRRFNVVLDPETEIVPCTGSKEAIYNFAFLFIEPGSPKNVIIGPSPGYFVMERSAIVLGAEYYPYHLNPENGFLLDLATVPESVLKRTAIVWLNYPHNPTGVECTVEYLRRQVEIARRYDIVVASDECYVDVYFGSTPPPSVLEVGTHGVVAFHSCSKRSGMTAYRTGFMAGDSEILQAYAAFRDTLGVAQPVYTQLAAAAAWSDDAHAAERRIIFKQKRDFFLDFLTNTMNLRVTPTESTFYLWVEAPAGMTGSQYSDRLLEAGIVVSPGSSFGAGCERFFRVALVPSLADCERVAEIWRELF
jgi:succinyldiaminopimelate transaminase